MDADIFAQPKSHRSEIGRLAFRVEDNKWNVYHALPETMDGATLLASIELALVLDKESKDAYLACIKKIYAAFVKDTLGQEISHYNSRPAPEHERKS